jgi:hypothetical protein
VLRDTPSAAGSVRSHPAISSPVSEFSVRLPQYGRMNRRIRYSRFAVVLGPTSCVAVQRSIQSLRVISPVVGSDRGDHQDQHEGGDRFGNEDARRACADGRVGGPEGRHGPGLVSVQAPGGSCGDDRSGELGDDVHRCVGPGETPVDG